MACQFVTGANADYFPMVACLIESFSRHNHRRRIKVCDFGLTPEQASFLRRFGALLERPDTVEQSEAFSLKANLRLFLGRLEVGDLVWIDADCLILGDLEAALDEAGAFSAGQAISAAPVWGEQRTLGQFLQSGRHRPEDVMPFRLALEREGIPFDEPYVNSGVILFRGRGSLDRWADIYRSMDPHVLREQNAFNILCHQAGYHPLDRAVFNITHEGLAEIRRSSDAEGNGWDCGGRPACIAHNTGYTAHHVSEISFAYRDRRYGVPGKLRTFENPDLAQYQRSLLSSFLRRMGRPLVEAGVAQPYEGRAVPI